MRGLTPVGDVIRDRRKALGWTQEQLATRVRCNSRTVRNAEQGKRIDGKMLGTIAVVLKIALLKLLSVKTISSNGILQLSMIGSKPFAKQTFHACWRFSTPRAFWNCQALE